MMGDGGLQNKARRQPRAMELLGCRAQHQTPTPMALLSRCPHLDKGTWEPGPLLLSFHEGRPHCGAFSVSKPAPEPLHPHSVGNVPQCRVLLRWLITVSGGAELYHSCHCCLSITTNEQVLPFSLLSISSEGPHSSL